MFVWFFFLSFFSNLSISCMHAKKCLSCRLSWNKGIISFLLGRRTKKYQPYLICYVAVIKKGDYVWWYEVVSKYWSLRKCNNFVCKSVNYAFFFRPRKKKKDEVCLSFLGSKCLLCGQSKIICYCQKILKIKTNAIKSWLINHKVGELT